MPNDFLCMGILLKFLPDIYSLVQVQFSSVQFIWQLKTNHINIYIKIYMKPGPLRSNLCL